MLENTQELLWKYMAFDSFMNHIDDYLDGKLYFSGLEDFNDPMEGVISLALRHQGYTDIADGIDDELKKYKVLCLTTDPENSAMWARYAGLLEKNNKRLPSVCVGIRLSQEYTKQLVKINYKDDIPLISGAGSIYDFFRQSYDKTDKRQQWNNVKGVLAYKFKSYEHEKERRLIIKSENAVTVKTGECVEIILGYAEQNEARAALVSHERWETGIKPKIGGMILWNSVNIYAHECLNTAVLKAIHKDPNNAIHYFNMAMLECNYSVDKSDLNLNISALHKTRVERALENYDKAIELKPDFAESYKSRGDVYCEQDDFERAIENYNEALEIKPDFAEAYRNRGVAFELKGDDENAIADYTKALELKPDFTQAYIDRGGVYGNKGDFDGAIANYSKGIELCPEVALLYLFRGHNHRDNGDDAKAIADYNKALELESLGDTTLSDYSSEVFDARGGIYTTRGECDNAIANYTQAIEREEDPIYDFYCLRGDVYYEKSDYDSAIADYTKALDIKADFTDASRNRGKTYFKKGDYNSAIADYNKIIADYIKELVNDRDFAPAKPEKISCAQPKDDSDNAITDYTKMLKLYPNFAPAYYDRAETYFEKGDYNNAILDYTKAIELAPDARTYSYCGDAYLKKGDYDSAITDYTNALKLCPDATTYNMRGIAFELKGEYDNAIADYDKSLELSTYAYSRGSTYGWRGIALAAKGELDNTIADGA